MDKTAKIKLYKEVAEHHGIITMKTTGRDMYDYKPETIELCSKGVTFKVGEVNEYFRTWDTLTDKEAHFIGLNLYMNHYTAFK